MLPLDRPFAGLDEVWIWPVPHPDDREAGRRNCLSTRIGCREGDALVGRVEVAAKLARALGGIGNDLVGMHEWRTTELGSVTVPHSDHRTTSGRGWVRSGGSEARWSAAGRFQLDDRKELSTIASRGGPLTAPLHLKDLGATAVALGRSLLRRPGDDEPDPHAPERIGDEVPGELTAFDGWLVATQHRQPVADGHTESWRVAIDHGVESPGSIGLALVVAALGLVHHPRLLHRQDWPRD